MTEEIKSAKKKAPLFRVSSQREKFALISNAALRDPTISYRAKGILAACLSHSEDFEFTRAWIEAHGTEGRDAIIAALKELRTAGYLQNIKIRSADGCVRGEYYKFSDETPAKGVIPDANQGRSAGVLENRTPENQRTGKPDAGFSGRLRRPTEEDQFKKTPHIAPLAQGRSTAGAGAASDTSRSTSKDAEANSATLRAGASAEWPSRALRVGVQGIELPEWLEPYREHITAWLRNRKKKHKLEAELTSSTLRGLEYAKDIGVLEEYCEFVSENAWRSLGFPGYKKTIDSLAKDVRPTAAGTLKPLMAPIIYTLN